MVSMPALRSVFEEERGKEALVAVAPLMNVAMQPTVCFLRGCGAARVA